MTTSAFPKHNELEALFVNNPDLDRIAAHMNRFNPIRVLFGSQDFRDNSNLLKTALSGEGSAEFGVVRATNSL